MAQQVFFKKIPGYSISRIRHAITEALPSLFPEGIPFLPGQKILLKPNLLTARPPESAVLTHPDVVAAMAEILLDCGCRISVGDSPGVENAQTVLRRGGYLPVIEKYGLEIIELKSGQWTPTPHARWFSKLWLASECADFDHLVNLPKLKTHSMMTLTLAVKNLFGCVPGTQKAAYHLSAGTSRMQFARLMLEIWETIAPTLSVMDGILALEGNGPSQGNPRFLGWLMASRNALSLDALIGDWLGFTREDHPIVQAALEAGLDGAGLESISLQGDSLERNSITDFVRPDSEGLHFHLPPFMVRHLKRWFTAMPRIDEKRCLLCGQCEKICPADAISRIEGNSRDRLNIRSNPCIRCFCCHEVCPHFAIDITKGVPLRWLEKISRRN